MSPVLLAAYDSAHSSSVGDYWVWSHHEVLADLRNSLYYDFLAKAVPKDGGVMGPGNCLGGYVQITDDWGCWYRSLDGGRDQFNRLGRFVICCGFIPTRGSARWDCHQYWTLHPSRGGCPCVERQTDQPAPQPGIHDHPESNCHSTRCHWNAIAGRGNNG